ncbi:MAG: hypothetical protein M0036_01185 [Desulfobacteraceae bacterium]|nr:hypothetical protein [Desulfobacteraceae bacterium]
MSINRTIGRTIGAIVGLSFMIVVSCVSPGESTKADTPERIMAENSQMKRRLPMLERENDVLKQENLQYRAKTQQMEANLEKTNSDLLALQEQYSKDMALNEEQIKSLHTKYNLFEAQSARTLEDLNKLYGDLQTKHTQEIKALNEKIAAQRTDFNKERDQLKQTYADMELKLSSQINELKSSLHTSENDINALKATNSEISQQRDDALRQVEKVKLERDETLQKLQAEKAANAELFDRLKKVLNETAAQKPAN